MQEDDSHSSDRQDFVIRTIQSLLKTQGGNPDLGDFLQTMPRSAINPPSNSTNFKPQPTQKPPSSESTQTSNTDPSQSQDSDSSQSANFKTQPTQKKPSNESTQKQPESSNDKFAELGPLLKIFGSALVESLMKQSQNETRPKRERPVQDPSIIIPEYPVASHQPKENQTKSKTNTNQTKSKADKNEPKSKADKNETNTNTKADTNEPNTKADKNETDKNETVTNFPGKGKEESEGRPVRFKARPVLNNSHVPPSQSRMHLHTEPVYGDDYEPTVTSPPLESRFHVTSENVSGESATITIDEKTYEEIQEEQIRKKCPKKTADGFSNLSNLSKKKSVKHHKKFKPKNEEEELVTLFSKVEPELVSSDVESDQLSLTILKIEFNFVEATISRGKEGLILSYSGFKYGNILNKQVLSRKKIIKSVLTISQRVSPFSIKLLSKKTADVQHFHVADQSDIGEIHNMKKLKKILKFYLEFV